MRLAFVDDDYGEIKKLTTMIDKNCRELFIQTVKGNFSIMAKLFCPCGNRECTT